MTIDALPTSTVLVNQLLITLYKDCKLNRHANNEVK